MYCFLRRQSCFSFVRLDAPEQEEKFQDDKAFKRNQLFSNVTTDDVYYGQGVKILN